MRYTLRTLPIFLALAFATVFFSCLDTPAARAGIVYSGTYFDILASTPVNAGVTPLKAVTLTVVAKDEYNPDAFDSVVNGGTGITTVGNKLHQVYQNGTLKTPTLTLDEDFPLIPFELDTHFLITDDECILYNLPSENRPTADATYNPFGGYGNKLYGTFTLKGTATPSWDLAYIVTPDQTTVSLSFVIAGVKGEGDSRWETVQTSFTVPEPSTLFLLAVGVFGLLVRRRRSVA